VDHLEGDDLGDRRNSFRRVVTVTNDDGWKTFLPDDFSKICMHLDLELGCLGRNGVVTGSGIALGALSFVFPSLLPRRYIGPGNI
jgi:hypothetical protein